jgi:hypothetical protein
MTLLAHPARAACAPSSPATSPTTASLRPATVDALLAHALQAYYAPGEQLAGPQDGPGARGWRWTRRGRCARGGAAWRLRARAGRELPGRRRARGASGGRHLPRRGGRVLPGVRGARHSRAASRRRTPPSRASSTTGWPICRRRAGPGRAHDARRARHARRRPAGRAGGAGPAGNRWRGAGRRAVAPHTPLGEALGQMQRQRVGSVVVVDEAARPLGILTRHDLLERVVLRQPRPGPRRHGGGRGHVRPAQHARAGRTRARGGPAHGAPRHAPCPAHAGRASGGHRLRARPLRAAAPVAGLDRRRAARRARPAGPARHRRAHPGLRPASRVAERWKPRRWPRSSATSNDLLAQRLYTLQAVHTGWTPPVRAGWPSAPRLAPSRPSPPTRTSRARARRRGGRRRACALARCSGAR